MKDLWLLFFLLSPAFVFGDYLDNNCGSDVFAPYYGSSSYTISDGADLNTDCVVHFDRSSYGMITLTITGSSLDSDLCQVNVKDSLDSSSLTYGNINSDSYFTRTLSSDATGELYVHVKGTSCPNYGLTFTLSQISSCSGFTCDNGRCVFNFDVCDDWDDCGDNSDERSCLSSSSIAGITVGSVVGLIIVIAIVTAVCRRNRSTVVYSQFGAAPAVISTSNMAVTSTSNMAVTQSRW